MSRHKPFRQSGRYEDLVCRLRAKAELCEKHDQPKWAALLSEAAVAIEQLKVDKLRDWMGGPPWPKGGEGFVVTDLDLVVRFFGRRFDLDKHGRFALFEVKRNEAEFPFFQEMTMGLVHCCCRLLARKRYLGFFLLRIDDGSDDVDEWSFSVNDGEPMSHDEFRRWVLEDLPKGLARPYTFANRALIRREAA